MNPRQPVVSGERLIKVLRKEGWEVVRQRGSHVRLKKPGRRDADLGADELRRLLD
ncbi:MAG TPA: type II toxin-antitoxin system HicA family toxin [Solirubrobacterales bacterium]|nr:type II toxin-antitoxin system HicA family toxin [Solirubrobacterales bacterium]